ncbi:MAG: hypothetical protein HY574_09495 [candidate division NC10 bacterium]|nr:hypothetical protein [candidate division NC10 bacterium]
MATKKQAPSDADRVFLSMQKPLKRAAKSIVKDQRRRDREEAAREKARQAELASEPEVPPYPGLDSLEVQARFAMNTITLARVALLAGECVDSDERDAAANLLWSAEVFLTSLDLERVALDKARARREAREAATRDRKAA